MIDIVTTKHTPDVLLAALADPTRRRIVELVAARPMTAGEIYAKFPIANPAVSRHLRVLREAGAIVQLPVSDRRIRRYTLQPQSLDQLSGWVAELGRTWQSQLDSFKDYVSIRSGRGHTERGAMPTLPAAAAEVVVGAPPEEAFRIFIDEIGLWWRRGTPYWNDASRGLSIRIEPHVGGRFMEVYDLDTGAGFEVGRVTEWEPGRRFAMTWTEVGWPQGATTEVEVTFEPTADGTRVRLEQTGFERLGAEAAGLREGHSAGWQELLGWFAERVNRKEVT